MLKSRLAVLLAEKRLSKKDFAKEVGISRNTIDALAADKNKQIRYDTIDKICNYLHITPGELFKYTPNKTEKDEKYIEDLTNKLQQLLNEIVVKIKEQ